MRTLAFSSILASVFLLTGTASGADVDKKTNATGTWVWESPGRNGETRESSVVLKQEGEKLTGKMISRRGESEIQDGKVTKDTVSFTVKRESQRGTMTAVYQGKMANGTIKGTMAIAFGDRAMTREWVAKRAQDVTGDWNWSMEAADGQIWEATLTLRQEGESVTGHFARDDSDWQLEIKEGKLSGTELTFQTVMERDGSSTTIESKATIAGETMKGQAKGTRDGQDWTREWQAEKK